MACRLELFLSEPDHPTPQDLKTFILSESKMGFELKLPKLELEGSRIIPISWLAVMQLFGVAAQLFTVALSMGCTFLVGKVFIGFSVGLSVEGADVNWNWMPFAVPAFFVIFSLITIVTKWLVVGRYRSCTIEFASFAYFRWWFVDRLVELW